MQDELYGDVNMNLAYAIDNYYFAKQMMKEAETLLKIEYSRSKRGQDENVVQHLWKTKGNNGSLQTDLVL